MEQLCINAIKTEKTVKNCAFSGHRVLQSDFSFETLEREVRKAIERGADTFYCGMAIGFDLLAAETVLQLKTEYGNVKLIACVPFYGQEKNFSVKDKERYRSILKSADEKVILSDEYYRGCMQVRNKLLQKNDGRYGVYRQIFSKKASNWRNCVYLKNIFFKRG